jgi:AcrR family transcriptional regulator
MSEEEIQTEEKIFQAATDIFEEKGMTGARMQDIANRAGINKALLHYYYRTKDKLFMAVFNKLAEKMFMKFSVILQEDVPINKKIGHFFSEHISFLQKNPKLPIFLLNEIGRNPELVERYISRLDFSKIKGSLAKSKLSNISERELAHLMISIVSLSVFPIVAKPILAGILSTSGIEYDDFIEERKAYSTDFVISYINTIQQKII